MTRIIAIGDVDYLVIGSDTRAFDGKNGEIHDGVEKIFALNDTVFYAFSGQKLIPAAILQNYREGRIKQSTSFKETIQSFVGLARLIKSKTPHKVSDNQFAILGYDKEAEKFRIVICHSSKNYDPMEGESLFAILGEANYFGIVWNLDEFNQIVESGEVLRVKIKKY